MSRRSRIFLTQAQDVGRGRRARTTRRFYPEGTFYPTLENALHLDLGESVEGGYEYRALRFYKRGSSVPWIVLGECSSQPNQENS